MSKGTDTRQAVLEQATEIAARLGLTGLTIGTLATATNLSKSGLYAHFRSKEALQLATLAHARENFIDLVVRPALSTPRGEPRLRALFERWLRFGRDELPSGCLFVSAATELDDRPGPVRDQLVRDHRDLLDTVAQIFATGITEGHFHPAADPGQFAHDLHAVMLGYLHAHRLLRDATAESRTRHAFTALLERARSGPPPEPTPTV